MPFDDLYITLGRSAVVTLDGERYPVTALALDEAGQFRREETHRRQMRRRVLRIRSSELPKGIDRSATVTLDGSTWSVAEPPILDGAEQWVVTVEGNPTVRRSAGTYQE